MEKLTSKLNEKPEISPLKPLVYSMLVNSDKENKSTVIDLQKLVENFKVDVSEDGTLTQLPAFIKKSYYQIQNLEKPDKLDFSYNFPPKSIEPDFYCLACKQKGPNNHTINCKRPFSSSLILNNETPRFPGVKEGAYYDLIVKKSGQKKIISQRIRSNKFTDNVEIIYENENNQQCVIRISRNGTILIISASLKDTDLINLIVYRINQTDAVKNYKIETTRVYLMSAQFNLFPDKSNFIMNLNALNQNLWKIPLYKQEIDNDTVFIISPDDYYIVNGYNYNSGEQYSKNNKLTNPFIQFNLITETEKINVQIYIRGAVQIRASSLDKTSEIDYASLEEIYRFLKELLKGVITYSHEASFDIIEYENKPEKKSKINNTVDKRQPQICQNRGNVKGGHDLRPVPYSFYGICPEHGYYVPPRGVRRPDGKVEPCCRKLVEQKDSPDYIGRYHDIIMNGYPDSKAVIFGETVNENDSAVYIPGTKIVESRSFKGLAQLSKKELTACISDNYIRKSDIFDKQKEISYDQFTANLDKFNVIPFKKIKTLLNLLPFTKESYMVSPIFNGTIRVHLYILKGKSYFTNKFNDISESGISEAPELSETVIEGYLSPFPEQFIFYPNDIIKFKGKDISELPFYKGNKNRINYLHETVNILQTKQSSLQIIMEFNIDIVGGSRNYLTNYQEVSGLLFTPYEGNDIRIWSDTEHENNIFIDLKVKKTEGNLWKLFSDNKHLDFFKTNIKKENAVPTSLISLPVQFTKGKPDEMFVLFKVNLNQTDFKIIGSKPLLPIEQIDQSIMNYDEVINILESITFPILRSTFINISEDPLGFIYHEHIYKCIDFSKPLIVI